MLRIAILCGGPSGERGISLNSARSFLDHASPLPLTLEILYVHPNRTYHRLQPEQLYSNTPADFDFLLSQTGHPLTEKELLELFHSVDLVFPLIHGAFGEGGTFQKFCEMHDIAYVGSPSHVCQNLFHKAKARSHFAAHKFATLPGLVIEQKRSLSAITDFWTTHSLKRAIVKPSLSGSSLGIRSVSSPQATQDAIHSLWDEGFSEFLLEPYSEESEFTICVLENPDGKAVALIPSEIDIGPRDGKIFDYRRKYLPTAETRIYCPPRFAPDVIQKIRQEAKRLFETLGLRDYARIDGWVSAGGEVRFSDLNPLSGMEQNSFLFQQAAQVGLSHTDLIAYVIQQSLRRRGKKCDFSSPDKEDRKKTPIYILFGGATAERQVSLLSGTNVWLKLRQETRYEVTPFLLDAEEHVWQLPYSYALYHTVDEILEHCQNPPLPQDEQVEKIRKQLHLSPLSAQEHPRRMSFNAFAKDAKAKQAFVFLALHGGIGEDGTVQNHLEQLEIPFNGSSAKTSRLCMDKRETSLKIESLQDPNVLCMPQLSLNTQSLNQELTHQTWDQAVLLFGTEDLLVKPQCDGCSTGVARLASAQELFTYIVLLQSKARCIALNTFQHQHGLIEMPVYAASILLEPFIHTDRIILSDTTLQKEGISGWCEMTIGVLERNGKIQALLPSLTVANSHILSVEEKFQGGTGINLTPPPTEVLPLTSLHRVQENASKAAQALGIRGYARLDLFVECATGRIRVIEANTLPALTPSTVLFHQALRSSPSLTPRELLVEIIEQSSRHTK